MNRHLGTDWSARDSHPSEDELLYYVDGELPAKEAAKVRIHLEACWTCRVRTERIEETISSFVHFLNDSIASNIGGPPLGWRRLDAGMARLAAEACMRPRTLRWLDALKTLGMPWPLPRALALGLLVALAAYLLVLRFDNVPPVSASQLIQKIEDVQGNRLRSVVQPVVHQKLQVWRKSSVSPETGVVSWEIWNDIGHNRFRQQIEDAGGQRLPGSVAARRPQSSQPVLSAALRELTQVLESNRMDPRNPLSSSSYAAWRGRIRRSSEVVSVTSLANGGRALTLTTEASGPFADNAVIQAQLVVRRADWHPIEQRLKVQGKDGILDFSLTETGFEVLPLGGLPSTLFASLTPPVLSKAPMPERPLASIMLPVVTPTSAELTAAEIEAMFVLHRIKACLGGMLSVVRTESPGIEVIEIQGLIDSAERREEIRTALQGVPWVVTKIQTMDEMASAAAPTASGPDSGQQEIELPVPALSAASKIPRGRLAIRDLLGKYFTEHQQAMSAGVTKGQRIADLSNRAVSLSETALQEAWALRRLAESFSALKIEDLRPSTHYALEVMIRDHMTALRTHINSSRELLEPVLSALLLQENASAAGINEEDAPGSPLPDSTTWSSDSLRLFAHVERIVDLSLGLFADTTVPSDQPVVALRELQSALGRSEAEFRNLAEQIARTFSESPDSFTWNGSPN